MRDGYVLARRTEPARPWHVVEGTHNRAMAEQLATLWRESGWDVRVDPAVDDPLRTLLGSGRRHHVQCRDGVYVGVLYGPDHVAESLITEPWTDYAGAVADLARRWAWLHGFGDPAAEVAP